MKRITAIVLAGGKSSRMGFDKAFLRLKNRPIITDILEKLKNIFDEVLIVSSPNKTFGYSANSTDLRVVSDVFPEKGPLGGIYTGLLNSKTKYNFVVACDMPFLNASLIRYLVEHKGNYDIIIPKMGKEFHPLFGIYSKTCIPVIEERLKQNKLRIANIFPKVKTHFISRGEIKKIDPKLLSLRNINTPDDFKKAKEEKPCLIPTRR